MKIIVINYRYFISGGPERYMFNAIELLQSKGHTVIPFSVKHNLNHKSEYEKYFMSPIGKGDEVYFCDYKCSEPKNFLKILGRMIYSFEAKRKLAKLIKAEKPDIIYCLQFQNKISCSIVDVANKYKIPFVQRISDYNQICPNRFLYNSKKNMICEKCVKGTLWNSVMYKCYGSFLMSFVKMLSVWFQKFCGIREKINAFCFTNQFAMQKYIEAGYRKEKCFLLPTFFNQNLIEKNLNISYEPYALYIGRLDRDKGMETLLKAFVLNKKPLRIIGFSSERNYEMELRNMLKNKKHNIVFLGEMKFIQMQKILAKCLFTIIPSEWYENLPNTLLESYALKKCVIATKIGSLKYAVKDGETGLLFEHRNEYDLAKKVDYLFEKANEAVQMGETAWQEVKDVYGAESHYEKLMKIFNIL
ncbi:MAG: glycosyltransferase family 4 protein [Fibromonadaceae bacterium]|jgi:glycosyltransferase involved in cell wall biosynthesis|nr:glycosyltransferase family 4 protein [Fibromonadaceae bacterium]